MVTLISTLVCRHQNIKGTVSQRNERATVMTSHYESVEGGRMGSVGGGEGEGLQCRVGEGKGRVRRGRQAGSGCSDVSARAAVTTRGPAQLCVV